MNAYGNTIGNSVAVAEANAFTHSSYRSQVEALSFSSYCYCTDTKLSIEEMMFSDNLAHTNHWAGVVNLISFPRTVCICCGGYLVKV